MDLLDRLLGHDLWTTQQLLLLCRGLTDEQLDRNFDIGHRTLRATLSHIVRNIEVWSDLMSDQPVREDPGPLGRSVLALASRLDVAGADLARVARAVAQRDGWDETWVDHLDSPPTEKTYGGAIAHVVTHSMHHRAQMLYLLRRVGVQGVPEGDVFSWEHRDRKGA
jgi:uncharacterized damage-inducible protein DinB